VATEDEKKKPNKLVIVIILMSIMIAISSAAIVFMSNGGKISDLKEKFIKHEDYLVKLDSIVVNLSSAGNGSYLKTEISLMYTDSEKTEMIDKKISPIRDVVIKNLMKYSPDDLLASGGLDKVGEKLKLDINSALGEDVIKKIYFTDFLIQ
jgi:flagellar protein FliL